MKKLNIFRECKCFFNIIINFADRKVNSDKIQIETIIYVIS